MVNFRRNFIKGGSYFFTLTLRDRRSKILVDNIDLLRQSFEKMMSKRAVVIDAIVILPDHLHTIFTLPVGDDDYPARWRLVKSEFTHLLKSRGYPLAKDNRGEHRLWQRRYWEHTLVDESDFAKHVDYIHYNPVKHGLVTCVCDWPYSSFHRYVKRGVLPFGWGGEYVETPGLYGE